MMQIEPIHTTGQAVKDRRLKFQMTQGTLARHMEVRVATISEWETGKRPIGKVVALAFDRVFDILEQRNKH